MKALRGFVAASALALVSLTAVVADATPASAAPSQVQVTFCYHDTNFQPLSAGHYVKAQYFSQYNRWVDVAGSFWTNTHGCIVAWVTPGCTWRFPIWAYDRYGSARWFSTSGDRVSSGGHLGSMHVA